MIYAKWARPMDNLTSNATNYWHYCPKKTHTKEFKLTQRLARFCLVGNRFTIILHDQTLTLPRTHEFQIWWVYRSDTLSNLFWTKHVSLLTEKQPESSKDQNQRSAWEGIKVILAILLSIVVRSETAHPTDCTYSPLLARFRYQAVFIGLEHI